MGNVERKQIAERVQKTSQAVEDANSHLHDLEKQNIYMARIKAMHQEKQKVCVALSQENMAELWDLCGKQIAIIERDLVLSEMDPESLAYQFTMDLGIFGKEKKKLLESEHLSLKNLLVNLKMYYFLLKSELLNLRKGDAKDIKKGLKEQGEYLKKIISYSNSDITLTRKMLKVFLKSLKEEIKNLFGLKGLIKPNAVYAEASQPMEEIINLMKKNHLSSIPVHYKKGYKILTVLDIISFRDLSKVKPGSSLTLSSNASIDKALETMLQNYSDEIYVLDKKPGIIRSYDFLGDLLIESIIENGIELAEKNKDIHNLTIKEIMTTQYDPVGMDASSDQVLKYLLKGNNPVIVQDKKEIAGVITMQDYFESVVGKDPLKFTAKDIMSSPPLATNIRNSVIDTILLMITMQSPVLIIKDGKSYAGILKLSERLEKELESIKHAKRLISKGVKVSTLIMASKQPNLNVEPILVSVQYPRDKS